MSDETPEVWEGYVRDADEKSWDELTFSNPEAAEDHVRQTLETMTGVPEEEIEFNRVGDRVQRVRINAFTGYVVRPKVHDTAPEKEEVVPDA